MTQAPEYVQTIQVIQAALVIFAVVVVIALSFGAVIHRRAASRGSNQPGRRGESAGSGDVSGNGAIGFAGGSHNHHSGHDDSGSGGHSSGDSGGSDGGGGGGGE